MKPSDLVKPTVPHLAGFLVGGLVFDGTGQTIDQLVGNSILIVPHWAAQYGQFVFYAFSWVCLSFAAVIYYKGANTSAVAPLVTGSSERKPPLVFPKRRQYFFYGLLILIAVAPIAFTLLAAQACSIIIERPENEAQLNGSFNVKGHIADPGACPVVQVWLRDLGKHSDWVLVDEFLSQQQNRTWGSRYVDLKDEGFKGPEVEIRALGWKVSFGPQLLSQFPPRSYLQNAASVIIEMKD